MIKPCRTCVVIQLLIFAAIVCGFIPLTEAAETEAPAPPAANLLANSKFNRVSGPTSGGSVLDVGAADGWCNISVGMPTVDYDGKLYRMWFAGCEPTSDADVPYGWYERIGMATSKDGVNWVLANGGKPVLDLGKPGTFDAKGVTHPYVMRVDGEYWMWYGGIDGRRAIDIGLDPTHVRIEQVGLAHSNDGIHWQRASRPVLEIGQPDSVDSIQATGMHVFRKDGLFWMIYGAYNGKHSLALAKSKDGINWEKANDGKPLTGLEGPEQLGPSVYVDEQEWFLLYGAPWKGGWATFAATSIDGIHWTAKVPGQPILNDPPDGNFDTGGRGRNFSVHPSQIFLENELAKVWYMGEDAVSPNAMRIGLMVAPLH
jgi:beta-xylosidase